MPKSAASSSTTLSFSNQAVLKKFLELPYLLVELVFEVLNEKKRLYLFLALLGSEVTLKLDYEPARYGAVMAMQEPFSEYVLDAELVKAELVLRIARLNPQIISGLKPQYAQRTLLTRNQKLIDLSGLVQEGQPLELGYSTSDWLPAGSNKEAMVEMLLRYLRMQNEVRDPETNVKRLPSGEELINETEQKLFPNGREAHVTEQQEAAKRYIEAVTSPLAEAIKTASLEDIMLALNLRWEANENVDAYIEINLADNAFWKTLMAYRAATKQWMQESKLYNPYLFEEALALCEEKILKERWHHNENNITIGGERLVLLYIHALGGIQAFNPTLVRMTDGSDDVCRFYNMDAKKREDFAYTRSLRSQHSGDRIINLVGSGLDLLGVKVWRGTGWREVAWRGLGGSGGWAFLSSKNKTLLRLNPDCRIDPTPTLNPNQACAPDEITHSSSRAGI